MATASGSVRNLLDVLLTVIALSSCLAWLAPRPQVHGEDLVQDYLSARALLAGESPYQPLQPLRERAHLLAPTRFTMRAEYNPHPPAAVILTLPVAGRSFESAYQTTRVVQIGLLAVAWVWAWRLAGLGTWYGPVVGGVALGLWPPVWGGLDWGQPVGLVAVLSVGLIWAAELCRPVVGGVWFATACLVRPFFAAAAAAAGCRRRREVVWAGLASVATAAIAFGLVGVWPWDWWRRASTAGEFAGAGGSITSVFGLPIGGAVAGFAGWTVAVAVLARGRLAEREAVTLGLTGGMLWYPLAWFHYDVALLPVAILTASTAVRRRSWLAAALVAGYMALRYVPPYGSIPGSMTWIPLAGRLSLLLACGVLLLGPRSRSGLLVTAP